MKRGVCSNYLHYVKPGDEIQVWWCTGCAHSRKKHTPSRLRRWASAEAANRRAGGVH